jgi:uncharacterized protein YdaL
MKHNLLTACSCILAIAALGCNSSNGSNGRQTPLNEQVAGVVQPIVQEAGQPEVVDVTLLGNPESINRFPADFGGRQVVPGELLVVPQERGRDKRPAAPVVANTAQYLTVPAGALILYDTTSTWGWLGELYGIAATNLAGHFGAATAKPVKAYVAGEMANFKAVIYVGSTYDEPLPVAFLDDVLKGTTTVVWIADNIWELANRSTTFVSKYGYNPWAFDTKAVAKVTYKGRTLTRDAANAGGLLRLKPFDATKVTTLATAVHSDGTTLPWAVRSLNLTYVTENPFSYISSDDRYLIFCDLLFDALAPTTPVNHRALVRLEDVSPAEDPVAFRAIVDYFAANSVPFSVAVIPLYKDPKGYYNNGKAETITWANAPQMLSAVKYATTKGGTLILHGYTHQFGTQKNPYSGVTADDFEFFLAHVDAKTNGVIYDGAVPGDSAAWATARVNSGLAAMATAGLPAPTIFEYPHYAGSPTDSKAIHTLFATAYHRGLYFGGDLGLTAPNLAHMVGVFYPYTVKDIYGWKVLPESLGCYEPDAQNNNPPRLAANIVATAQNNLVIRDNVASFYFHPYNPLSQLKAIVTGVKAAGYTFVSAGSL